MASFAVWRSEYAAEEPSAWLTRWRERTGAWESAAAVRATKARESFMVVKVCRDAKKHYTADCRRTELVR
jgi:hypothetical protein